MKVLRDIGAKVIDIGYHYAHWIWLLALPALWVSTVIGSPWGLIVAMVVNATTVSAIVGCAMYDMKHWTCLICQRKVGLDDAPALAERHRQTLVRRHKNRTYFIVGVVAVAICITAIIVGATLGTMWTCVILIPVHLWLGLYRFDVHKHNLLQPWCPKCGPLARVDA